MHNTHKKYNLNYWFVIHIMKHTDINYKEKYIDSLP